MLKNAFPEATILGYPRIGANRELKKAEEAYWAGKTTRDELETAARDLRLKTYAKLAELGLKKEDSSIPASFSYYDQVLDACATFGIIPSRFANLRKVETTQFSLNGENGQREIGSFGEKFRRTSGVDEIDLDTYFTIARGDKSAGENGLPGEMTKWFDTNYHYIVPEFHSKTSISLASYEIVRQFQEAKSAGYQVRPVIVGPATLLALGKYEDVKPDQFLVDLVAAYSKLLYHLAKEGCEWVQFDEPALISDNLDFNFDEIFEIANKFYHQFSLLSVEEGERPAILLTTPYAGLENNVQKVAELEVEALHFDLVRGEVPQNVKLENVKAEAIVGGVVNGRNIWRSDLEIAFEKLQQLKSVFSSKQISVATSNSLQHVPHTIQNEKKLAQSFPQLVSNLSFADEKVQEVVELSSSLKNGSLNETRTPNQELVGRKVEKVAVELGKIAASDFNRESIEERKIAQQKKLNLPLLPTTTIGSFPQTPEIRKARAAFNKGEISADEYQNAMKDEIKQCVELQTELGIDVLVHGEAERNDMVQYFAENFEGFDVTENGWVQSYGSRCTKPSILWGDVYRENAFTVPWISYAQSLTDRFMKGMLTGPVTILAWSFVRDDQSLETTANQVALALRDEIKDLETAGIKIIQVDEPALRELLPLKNADHQDYLRWSVNSFRLATSSVAVDTQIHTHLCYSEFEVIINAIIGLNADVTSIEAARSKFEIVPQLVNAKYPLGVGPGVYDIHSPRVPTTDEMTKLLQFAVDEYQKGGLPLSDLWVNPDCGLKTRKDEESTPSLKNMVEAALSVRAKL